MDLLLVVKIISNITDSDDLKNLIDPNMKDKNGASILETVCADTKNPKVETLVHNLIKIGANVNYQNSAGWTALHFAATNRDDLAIPIMKILIHKGADPNLKDSEGRNAMMCLDPDDPKFMRKSYILITAGATFK